MDNKEFAKMLEQRTKQFAIRIIRLSSALPYTPEGKVIRNQITIPGTSVGANYREANRARSKADFNDRIKICEGEISETVYWADIISELKWYDSIFLKETLDEANELLALFSTIGKTLKL